MRNRLIALAALIFALHAEVSYAQNYPLPPDLRTAPATVVVDRLLAGREALALSPEQVASLTTLSSHLAHERGHFVIIDLDQVPGRSVPRLMRVKTTADQAYHQALKILSPEQQGQAAKLLAGSTR